MLMLDDRNVSRLFSRGVWKTGRLTAVDLQFVLQVGRCGVCGSEEGKLHPHYRFTPGV